MADEAAAKAKEEEARLAKIEADKEQKRKEAEALALAEQKKLEAVAKAKAKEEARLKKEAEKLAKAKAKEETRKKKEAEKLAKKKAKEEKARLAKIEADKEQKRKEAEALALAEQKKLEEATAKKRAEAVKKAEENAQRLAQLEKERKAKEEKAKLENTDKGDEAGKIVSKTSEAAKRRVERMAEQKANKEEEANAVKEPEAPVVEKTLAPSEQKLRPFYFPMDELKNGKAYQYIAGGTNPDTTYRLMRAMNLGGQMFLITEEYNRNFEPKNIKKEHITDNGVFVKTFSSYESDGLDKEKIVCGVDADDYITWGMKAGDKSYVQYNFNSKFYPNFDVVVKKNIELLKDDETIEYNGQQLKVITVKDAEITVFTNHKKVSEERYKLEYINKYAEGVGLVEYAIQMVNHPTEVARTYQLSQVMSYSDWSQIAKKRNPKSN